MQALCHFVFVFTVPGTVGFQYVITGVMHGYLSPTQVSLASLDAQERVRTSVTSSGKRLMLVLTPKLSKNGERS